MNDTMFTPAPFEVVKAALQRALVGTDPASIEADMVMAEVSMALGWDPVEVTDRIIREAAAKIDAVLAADKKCCN